MAGVADGRQQESVVASIHSAADLEQFRSKHPSPALHVVYFHAPWAGPCKQMSAVLDALAAGYPATQPARIGFASINAESSPDLASKYEVETVPLVILERDGAQVERMSGSNAPLLRTLVEKHTDKPTGEAGAALPALQSVTKAEPPTQAVGQVNEAGAGGDGAEEDVVKRISQLVKAAPVMLFMKGTPGAPQCGFSRQTVALLRENSIRYGFFNILADDDVRQGLKKYADWPTYPQLWVDGELVGGLDIVSSATE